MHRLDHDAVSAVLPQTPATVFAVVSDVTRTPQWSPQVVDCSWLDGATEAAVGARFAARNRNRWFRWTNVPLVTTVDPGRTFAFSRTEHGGGTMEWSYRLAPHERGTAVTLSYDVIRPVPLALHVILRVVLGVKDLRADLHENMAVSLRRLGELLVEDGRSALTTLPSAPTVTSASTHAPD
jgi:hypothetical protein